VAGIWHPGYYGLGVCHLATDRFSGDWVRQTPPRAVKLMRIASVAQTAQYAATVQAAGHTSLTAIAGQLNARKVATANGGRWKHLQVKRILTGNIRRV
jgi:Recombinase